LGRVFRIITVLTLIMIFFSVTAFAARIIVKEGCRGHAVRTVQTLLIEQGYLKGEADGIAGPMTAAAIKKFQKDKGLEVDGICGAATFEVLSGGKEYQAPEGHDDDYCETHGDHFKPKMVAEVKEETHEAHETSPSVYARGHCVYVEATAYSAFDPGNKPTTASGTLVRHGVIAVDPAFIPLGTRVFIPGYGEAVAEDIGWGIKGNIIDVAFDSHEEALAFGRQHLEIYIID